MRKMFERAILLCLIGAILMTGCTPGQEATVSSKESTTSATLTTKKKEMVRPDLTEEEIINMSDEKLTELGLLLIEHQIEDVQTPNPQRKEFGFTREEGYRYAGMPAQRSASDYEEALNIAKEEWQDDLQNKYTDISLLGENDKFWLFKCTNYYGNEFNMICTAAVWKKDYYDEETSTAFFELNEENIRNFFAYRSYDQIDQGWTCIGEFVIKTDEGFIFRRYSMMICYGDYGINDEVSLSRSGWKISNDGKIEPSTSEGFGRSLELPVSSIGDYPG